MKDKNTMHLYKGNAITMEEILQQKVQEKLVNEYNKFVNGLKREKPEVIIERAYEKVCKQEMVYCFEKKNLSASECKAILKSPNILDECYDEWLKSDGNFNEMLEYSIDDAVEHIENDYKRDIKQKNKDAR